MNTDIINLKDESGNDVVGKLLNVIEIDDIEYLLYSVSVNDDEDALYVKKIVKNQMGEDEDLIDISDESEKEKVYGVVKEYVRRLG